MKKNIKKNASESKTKLIPKNKALKECKFAI